MKHTYTKYLVLFALSLGLGACGDKNTATPEVEFEGYTGRDHVGQLTSPYDPTDWTTDASWTNAEMNLFAKYNLSFSPPMLPANAWQVYARDNPVSLGGTTDFIMVLDKNNPALPVTPNSEWIRVYYLVDTRFNVLFWDETNGINKNFGSRISYPATKYSADKLYRIYYVIFNKEEKTVYYKGHGDIKVVH